MRVLFAITAFTLMLFSTNLVEAANHSHGCTGKYFYCPIAPGGGGCCVTGEKCRSNGCIGVRQGEECGQGHCLPGQRCGTENGAPKCFK
jgi:hypothetical protein